MDVNSSLQIFCSVRKGAQPFFFEWFKNSQPIRSEPGVKWQIETSKKFSTLDIDRINREDAGNYSCLVKNIHGSDSINVMLTVKGMPFLYLNLSFAKYINVWRHRFHKFAEPLLNFTELSAILAMKVLE